jgi:hypothetical protein
MVTYSVPTLASRQLSTLSSPVIAASLPALLLPYSFYTDFVQAESVTMLLSSLGSIDDNKAWALTVVSFCITHCEDPVIMTPCDFRSH